MRFPGRPLAAAGESANALLDFLHRQYRLAACHPLLEKGTRNGMLYHVMAMDIVITMIKDPNELGRDLAPVYAGIVDAGEIQAAVGSWMLHEQIEAGH